MLVRCICWLSDPQHFAVFTSPSSPRTAVNHTDPAECGPGIWSSALLQGKVCMYKVSDVHPNILIRCSQCSLGQNHTAGVPLCHPPGTQCLLHPSSLGLVCRKQQLASLASIFKIAVRIGVSGPLDRAGTRRGLLVLAAVTCCRVTTGMFRL